MKIKYTLGKTINVGNYNSVRIELSVEDEGDNTDCVLYERLRDYATSCVAEEETRLREEANNND